MKKAKVKDVKKLIYDLLAQDDESHGSDKRALTVQEMRELEFYVENGHLESLAKNALFRRLSPEEKIQTFLKALDNHIDELRGTLMPLGRSERTRDAYIQILNIIHDWERLKDEILEKFYSNAGKRQISDKSKGEKIDFF